MNRKALLVGINRYAVPGSDLKGCVNDVRLMEAALADRYGFPSPETRILLDGEATGSAIREGLAWLVDGCLPGDSLVFHYSGHGSQVPDPHGDETLDGLDEIICPHDMDWNDPLTDDELGRTFSAVPEGALVTVILDCCHSGTGLRETAATGAPRRHRYLPPPSLDGPGRSLSPRMKRTTSAATPGSGVLISGCRSDQTSADAEIGGKYHGALTYYLHQVMSSSGWRIGCRELVARTRAELQKNRFSQEPQLEGPDRLLDGSVFATNTKGGHGESDAA